MFKSYPVRLVAWLMYFNFIDVFAMLFAGPAIAKKRKRVVFVKVDGIGDYIMWTASFEAYKRIYPSSEFERVLVGNDKWKILAENESTFERKIFVNNERMIFSPSYRFGLMRSVRKLDPDIVVNPRLTRDFLWGDSISRCSGAPIRIGSVGLDNLMTKFQESLSARWYTKLVEKADPHDHELVSNLKFMRALEPSVDFEFANPTLASIPGGKPFELAPDYAVFFVGAFEADRRWPTSKFIETAEFVATKYGFQIVVCGGPGDIDSARGFETASIRTVNLIGSTSLLDLKSIIESARLVVSNDTGAAHMAAAARCPTVVITPGNTPGRFFPYPMEATNKGIELISVVHEMPCVGCGWACIYKDLSENDPTPCIADIPAGHVIGAITKLLGNAETARSDVKNNGFDNGLGT